MVLSVSGARRFQIEMSGTVVKAFEVMSAQKLYILYNLIFLLTHVN